MTLARLFAATLACLAAASASAAAPAGVLTTQGSFTPFNSYPDSSYGAGGTSWYGGPTGSLDYTTSFTALNSAGDTQTMTITAQASATADPGVLHASANLTVANPFYNAANAPYVNPDFSVNENGAPDFVSVYSSARFDDSLLVSASPGLTQLKVSVTLDGTIDYGSGLSTDPFLSPAYTQASVAVTNSSGQTCSSCGTGNLQGAGSYDRTFDLYIPVNDPSAVDLGLQMYLYDDFYFTSQFGYSESDTYAVSLDFSHTLKITGVAGLDANDAPVSIDSITSSSGVIYPVTAAVPEPSTAVLALLGLVALGLRSRRSAAA